MSKEKVSLFGSGALRCFGVLAESHHQSHFNCKKWTLELWAAVAGIHLLSEVLPGMRTFLFVDNESARASLISLSSSIASHGDMLRYVSTV